MKKHRFLPYLVFFGCAAIVLALWWPRPLPRTAQAIQWRKATDIERRAAIKSIESQLNAFRSNDYKTAVKYQSSGLQRNFKSVEAFRTMMRSSYPQFTNYKTAYYGPAQSDKSGRFVVIPVQLVGRDKVKVTALYTMVLEKKIYRVDGVVGGNVRPSLPNNRRHGAPPPSTNVPDAPPPVSL